MLTATFNSYGNRQISPHPLQNQYPWTDRQKNRHNWLRPRGDPYTKFGKSALTEGAWANWWNITRIIIIYLYLFFCGTRTSQWPPVDGFLHAIAQKTWNYARMYGQKVTASDISANTLTLYYSVLRIIIYVNSHISIARVVVTTVRPQSIINPVVDAFIHSFISLKSSK